MTDLTTKRCLPCEGGVKPLTQAEISNLIKTLKGWTVADDFKEITKTYSFKNFYFTMSFVNAVAYIANQENHHPDLEVSFNRCIVHYRTHAIDGLSENDLICAAKIDSLTS